MIHVLDILIWSTTGFFVEIRSYNWDPERFVRGGGGGGGVCNRDFFSSPEPKAHW